MASGTPIVGTPMAASIVENGKHALIGKNAKELAAFTSELLKTRRKPKSLQKHKQTSGRNIRLDKNKLQD
jgi:hypothetical protein